MHDISDVVVVIQDLFPLPPSLDLSLSLPSHPIQLMPPSLHVRPRRVVRPLVRPSANRMKIALSAKFKYGHATPERVGGREGKGERPFANENSLYLPKWRPQRRYKDTMAPTPRRRRRDAITHITMGRDSEKRDAGWLCLRSRFHVILQSSGSKITVAHFVVTVTVTIANFNVSL